MKVSIKYALIFGLIGLIFLSALFSITSSYVSSEKAIISHSKDIMQNISAYTIEKSQSYLSFARDAAKLTASLADSNVVSGENKNQMEAYFYEQLAVYPQFSNIYYGDQNGSFIMVSRDTTFKDSQFRTKIIRQTADKRSVIFQWKDKNHQLIHQKMDPNDQYDPRQRPWYSKAVQKDGLIWTAPYLFFTTQKPGVTTASPIYDKNKNLKGVVGVDIEIDEISDFLSKLTVGKNGRAFILNKNGDVIAFPDKSKITHMEVGLESRVRLIKINEINEPITQKAFASLDMNAENIRFDKTVFTEFIHKDETYHAMFSPFTNDQWSWSIGLYIPEDDYLGGIKANRLFNLWVLAVVILIYAIIAYIMGKSIEKPLAQLEKETVSILSDRADVTLSVKSKYKEIQNMADSFQTMKEKLNEKHQEISKTNEQLTLEIAEKEKTASLLQASLDEKEILMKEIHHRVKNNLQVISSLLRLQAQYHTNQDVVDIIMTSQSRVHSMALVHENLFQSDNVERMNFKTYVTKLTENIINSFIDNGIQIITDIECENIEVPVDLAIPCGLIINEIITNSIKHAFSDVSKGNIDVQIKQEKDDVIIIISDDGKGFVIEKTKEKTDSLGYKLITSLVQQLNGEMNISSNDDGTSYLIKFPLIA